MKALRRLAYSTLGLAYALIVFGAIVRISGSGMGCGDHWPRCFGRWFPPMDQPTLVIEWTHRLLAAITVAMVAVLVMVALRKRGEPGVSGPRGVLRAALLAGGADRAAGAAGHGDGADGQHRVGNCRASAERRAAAGGARGHGASRGRPRRTRSLPAPPLPARARRGDRQRPRRSRSCTVLFGGLTAKIPGANTACEGFPLCRGSLLPAIPAQHVQFTHRILAFLLFLHVLGLMIGFARRREAPAVLGLVRVAFALICLQLVIAAGMVEMHLPPVMRSLHEADGIAIWLDALHARMAGALLRMRAARPASVRDVNPAAASRVTHAALHAERRVTTAAVSERSSSFARDLVMLTKPRIISLLLVTTIAPMYIAGEPEPHARALGAAGRLSHGGRRERGEHVHRQRHRWAHGAHASASDSERAHGSARGARVRNSARDVARRRSSRSR